MGAPIYMPKAGLSHDENSPKFQDLVDEVHQEFCDRLIGMFDRHKHRYGWGHKRLLIV